MSIAPELVDRFRADLEQLWPFVGEPSARLGLAVSGGGDSLALLLLAHALLPGRVEAATVEHGLRPESAAEAELVARYCTELNVPHVTLPVTLGSGNLQDRARTARYGAMGNWCEQRDLQGLATAHQLDDQAETVLMRLNRGSGVAGLAAIRALGTVPDRAVRLVRPLLRWRRADLAEIVRASGWQPANDASNDDTAFDRVRMRRALGEAHWLDRQGIARSAELLAEADQAITWTVGREYSECVSMGDGEIYYHALRTGSVGTLIRGEVVRAIFRVLGSAIGRGEAAELVTRLIAGEKTNIGAIQASVRDVGGERVWVFAPENRRRIG